jgi:hypothetical protein
MEVAEFVHRILEVKCIGANRVETIGFESNDREVQNSSTPEFQVAILCLQTPVI